MTTKPNAASEKDEMEHPRLKDITDLDDRALYRCGFKDGREAGEAKEKERAKKLLGDLSKFEHEFSASAHPVRQGIASEINKLIKKYREGE